LYERLIFFIYDVYETSFFDLTFICRHWPRSSDV